MFFQLEKEKNSKIFWVGIINIHTSFRGYFIIIILAFNSRYSLLHLKLDVVVNIRQKVFILMIILYPN